MPVSMILAVLLATSAPAELPVLRLHEGALEPLLLRGEVLSDSLPPVTDLASDLLGRQLLVLEGGLLHFLGAEGLVPAPEDLPRGSTPSAVASDGGDWWVLPRMEPRLFRLGRQGELLGGFPLPEDFWEDLACSPSGILWLADSGSGRFLKLSRSGQVLGDWLLEERVPGFGGVVDSWDTDPAGGLWLVEGGRLRRLNAAGNLTGSWDLPPAFRRAQVLGRRGGTWILGDRRPACDLGGKGILLAGEGGRLRRWEPVEP